MTHPSNHKKDQILAAYQRLRDRPFNLSMVAREAEVSIGIFANYKALRDEIMTHPNYLRGRSQRRKGVKPPQRQPQPVADREVEKQKDLLIKTAKEWRNHKRFRLLDVCQELGISFDVVLYSDHFLGTRRTIWKLSTESRSRWDSKNQPRKKEGE